MAAPGVLSGGDICEITHRAVHTQTSAEIINRYYVRVNFVPAVPASTILQMADKADDVWDLGVMSELSSTYRLVSTEARRVSGVSGIAGPPRRAVLTYNTASSVLNGTTGSKGGDALPQFVTVSARFYSTLVGRFWRGGMRLGPIAVTDQDSANKNMLSVTARGLWDSTLDAWNTVHTMAGLSEYTPVIFSPVYYAFVLMGGALEDATTPIVNVEPYPYFRSQVSRLAPHVP